MSRFCCAISRRCISGGRSATWDQSAFSFGVGRRFGPRSADEVGYILLALLCFLKCLIGSDFAVVAGAGKFVAKLRGGIFPADVAIVFGGDGKECGQDAELAAAIFVSATFELGGGSYCFVHLLREAFDFGFDRFGIDQF